jgi:V8-like Glu-specific endopeptidase
VEKGYRLDLTVTKSTDEFARCIVRIFKITGEVVGAGLLVSPRHILTCAHVINRVLSKDVAIQDHPGSTTEVQINFPFGDALSYTECEKLSVKVVLWHPMAEGKEDADIAILELEQDHDGSIPILRGANESPNTKIQAYGFPPGDNSGAMSRGEIVIKCANGRVQITANVNFGYFFEPGFSGAPVWDEKLCSVLGLAVTADPLKRSAFMIPSSVLEPICRSLRWRDLEQLLRDDWSQLESIVKPAYTYAIPPGSRDSIAPSDPETLFLGLINFGESASTIAKFIAYLSNQLTGDLKIRLLGLGERLFTDFTAIHSETQRYIREEYTTNQVRKRPHLLIRANSDDDAKIIDLRAWLIISNTPYAQRDIQQWQLKSASFASDSNEIDINDSIKSWILESGGYGDISGLVIEIFLPIQLFHLPIEKDWKVGANKKYLTPIGKSYPVIFRDPERLQKDYLRKDDWRKYWDKLELNAHQYSGSYLVHPENINDFDDVCSCLRSCDESLGIKIATMLPSEATFAALQETAHPVGIWLRRESFDSDYQISLEQFLCENILGKLAQAVMQRRNKRICPIGEDLVLTLENPYLIPPDAVDAKEHVRLSSSIL